MKPLKILEAVRDDLIEEIRSRENHLHAIQAAIASMRDGAIEMPAAEKDADPLQIRIESVTIPQPNLHATGRRKNRDERDAEIKRMWALDWSVEYIADQIGLTGASIHIIKNRLGLPKRSRKAVQAATTLVTGRARRVAPPRAARRFEEHHEPKPEEVTPLADDHPAVIRGKTLFPTTVVEPNDSPRLLVSGANSRKLGSVVTKGELAGFPIYHLTLEERATCPVSCYHWRTCYGNAMPFTRRHRHGHSLIGHLHKELAGLQAEHPKGFLIRLHNLGDFYAVAYAEAWIRWLEEFPALHVFGYTAWAPDTPIGRVLLAAREEQWNRFAIRFSGKDPAPGGSTTIWTKPASPRVTEGIVCPAQTGATDCCGSCGLCWSLAAKDETIVFIGHGMKRPGRPMKPADVEANKRAARHLPKDAPMIAEPMVEKPFEGEKKFQRPLDRRCQNCNTMFETKDVEQLRCVSCRVLFGDRRVPA